jgi:hypothetical protein
MADTQTQTESTSAVPENPADLAIRASEEGTGDIVDNPADFASAEIRAAMDGSTLADAEGGEAGEDGEAEEESAGDS